jgi:hypothetical protein
MCWHNFLTSYNLNYIIKIFILWNEEELTTMAMDPFQMLKKETLLQKAVLLPGWVMQMIIIVFQNHTAQIHKPGLQRKAGKLKRKRTELLFGHLIAIPAPIEY